MGDVVEVVLIVIGFLIVALVLRLVAGGWDHDRIRHYVADRGGRVQSIEWAPFGRGWLGSENERIYQVRYVDREGNVHDASCKTSMMAGVYFTEDTVVRFAPMPQQQPPPQTATPDEIIALREENERLKEELRRMQGS